MTDDGRSEADRGADGGLGLRRVREALATMDAQLTAVLARAATGREGFITREWGFITPGGLGLPLGGKFAALKKAGGRRRLLPGTRGLHVLPGPPLGDV